MILIFTFAIYWSLIYILFLYADFDDPVIYVNDEWVSDRIAVDIQEKNPLQIFCYAEGGPTPTVRLGKSQNGGTVILSEARDHWSNYSFGTGAQCSGQSTDLNTNTKAIDVNILCKSLTLHVINPCTINICFTLLIIHKSNFSCLVTRLFVVCLLECTC